MKFSAVVPLSALVATALAAPAEVVARTGGGGETPPSTCNNNQQQVCCAGVVGLLCLVDILGGNCNGGAYCCDSGSSVVSCQSISQPIANPILSRVV